MTFLTEPCRSLRLFLNAEADMQDDMQYPYLSSLLIYTKVLQGLLVERVR